MSLGRVTDSVPGGFRGDEKAPLGTGAGFLKEVMFGLELGG